MKDMAQAHAGLAGTSITVTAGFAARVVAVQPLLQDISLIMSIIAGLATVCWYAYKFFTRK